MNGPQSVGRLLKMSRIVVPAEHGVDAKIGVEVGMVSADLHSVNTPVASRADASAVGELTSCGRSRRG